MSKHYVEFEYDAPEWGHIDEIEIDDKLTKDESQAFLLQHIKHTYPEAEKIEITLVKAID